MSFSFKYKPAKLKSGKAIYRPMLPLTIFGEETIDIFAMLDSGSDISVLPKEIAETLEIKYFEEDELYGITGNKVKSKIGRVNISFGKGRENYRFQIPVVVPEKGDTPIILGRTGFFNKFKITFFEKEKRIIFKKVPDKQLF